MAWKLYYSLLDDPNEIPNTLEPTEKRIIYRNKRDGFYKNIEADILKNGIINPINVWYGNDDAFYKVNKINKWYVQRGGTRLYIAQKHCLPIPVLVSAHEGDFTKGWWEIKKEDFANYYTSLTKEHHIKKEGLWIGELEWQMKTSE